MRSPQRTRSIAPGATVFRNDGKTGADRMGRGIQQASGLQVECRWWKQPDATTGMVPERTHMPTVVWW